MLSFLTTQLFGGHVLQAKMNGADIFYLAPQSLYKAGQARRGGVPVLFPQFNNEGFFPKHGFARLMDWQLLQVPASNQHWRAILNADAHSVAPAMGLSKATWPHKAVLTIDALINDQSLKISLTVKNVGSTEFSFTGGLHPYFCWPRGDIEIEQLGVRLSRDLMIEQGEGVEEKFLHRSDRLTVLSATQKMTMKKFGFEEWMVWNPGPKHGLQDIEYGDWRDFYCLEPISSVNPHWLKPGEEFVGGFSLQIDPR
jgi:glucose-6-phosphate 1-epimerase